MQNQIERNAFEEIEELFEEYDNPEFYEAVRTVLAPEHKSLSNQEISYVLTETLAQMSPEEVEAFGEFLDKIWKGAKSIVRKVAPVVKKFAPTVLPVAGAALGGIFGGPAGIALGSKLGGMAGSLIKGKPKQALSQVPGLIGGASPVPVGGTNAATQIMSLIQNPKMIQSLLGQALGGLGANNVQVGKKGATAPAGALMNLLAQLATQAAMEANYRDQSEEESIPEYLLDNNGNLLVEDIAVPEQRARLLMTMLNDEAKERIYTEQDNYHEDLEEIF